MTPGVIALLVGVFGVPMLLLWAGHRLRRRSNRWRTVFWGSLIGYGVGAAASLLASMTPPVMWASGDMIRGLLGFWAPLGGAVIGAIVGAIASASRVSSG